jgi:hypothetical protein
MRATERSSQAASVRPQLSKLKEKHRWKGIHQFPKFMPLFFTRKLADAYNSYTSAVKQTSNLLKL